MRLHFPSRLPRATKPRIVAALLLAAICAAAAFLLVPRGIEAEALLSNRGDPTAVAERALDKIATAPVIIHEIEAALAANDPDLANSFVDLARDRGITVPEPLKLQVAEVLAAAKSSTRMAQTFAEGFITGEPHDVVGLAGTALGDFFVFGDVRDAVREGAHYARGEEADEMILGLACVGLAITAGTYATFGASTPARVGVSVVKAARKTGGLGGRMAQWIGHSLQEVIDWTVLRRAIVGASLSEPAVAVHAAREAVKVEKAGGLLQLIRNVGRVQSRAGSEAALDTLKIADTPRDVERVAQLAEKEGSKTRATLKLLGRGAVALTLATFNLSLWVLGAIFALLGFVISLKSGVERFTWRHLQRRKARAMQQHQQQLMMAGL